MATNYEYEASFTYGYIKYNMSPNKGTVIAGDTIQLNGVIYCSQKVIKKFGFTTNVGSTTILTTIAKGKETNFTTFITVTAPPSSSLDGRGTKITLSYENIRFKDGAEVSIRTILDTRLTYVTYRLDPVVDLIVSRCDKDGTLNSIGEYAKIKSLKLILNPQASKNDITNAVIHLYGDDVLTIDFILMDQLDDMLSADGYSEDKPVALALAGKLHEDQEYAFELVISDYYESFSYIITVDHAFAIVDFANTTTGGFAVGTFSSATENHPKFEVAESHESHLYGPTYIHKGISTVGGGANCDSSRLALGMQSGDLGRASNSVSAGKSQDYAVNFLTPFASVPIVFVDFYVPSDESGAGRCAATAVDPTTNGFTLRFHNGDTVARQPYLHWLAIGQMDKEEVFNGGSSGGSSGDGGGGTIVFPIAVSQGGTGATNSADALYNLNAVSKADAITGLALNSTQTGLTITKGNGSTSTLTLPSGGSGGSASGNYVSKTGDTMTGNLIINKSSPAIELNPQNSSYSQSIRANDSDNGALSLMSERKNGSNVYQRILKINSDYSSNYDIDQALQLISVNYNGFMDMTVPYNIYHSGMKTPIPVQQGGTGATSAYYALRELGAVDKTGDTMTGLLTMENDLYPSIVFNPTYDSTYYSGIEGSYIGSTSMIAWERTSSGDIRRMLKVNAPGNTDINNAIQLEVYTSSSGEGTDYNVFHSGMTTGIPIAQGGTGATSASTALSNLGGVSKTDAVTNVTFSSSNNSLSVTKNGSTTSYTLPSGGSSGGSSTGCILGSTTITLENTSSSARAVSGTIPTISGAKKYICTGVLGWSIDGRPGVNGAAPTVSGSTLIATLAGNSTVMFGILGVS